MKKEAKEIWKQPLIPNIAYKDFLKNQKQPKRTDKNYVDFWLKHINYCKSGVNVGGIFISGWLYWHLNFFQIPLDGEDEYGLPTREVGSPKFRDNEFLLDWGYNNARKQGKQYIVFGSRRISKSTYLASRLAYTAFLRRNSYSITISASSKDIGYVTEYFTFFYERRPDCFSDLRKIGDWSKEGGIVEIAFSKRETTKKDVISGQKNKINPITPELLDIGDDNKYVFSRLALYNLEFGQKATKEEMLAGGTPTEVILDEIGKMGYHESLSAVKPALLDINGNYRAIIIGTGTGGNIEMSKNAQQDFLHAEDNNTFHFDVNEYTKIVNKEYFKYEQKSSLKTGVFPCGQMSNAGGQKIEIPLSEYVIKDYSKKDLEDLEGFTIWVTDWEKAKENVLKEIAVEQKKSDKDGKKAQMYYPFQPEDCFLYVGNNPFPADEALKHKQELIEKGLLGEYIEFDQDEHGNIKILPSDKKIVTEYPFKGGSHDAPGVMYERPISENPDYIKYGTYVAGFDGYKIGTSETTDSLGSFHIYKLMCGFSGFQKQIVFSLATRPTQDSKFHRQVYLALRAYNAEILPERDTALRMYMQSVNGLRYWANCKNLVMGLTPKSIADTDNGLPATTPNQEYYLKLIKQYCYEEITIGFEEDGKTPIIMMGIKRIPDIMLLEEIAQYGLHKNHDRIVSFGHALAWAAEMDNRGVVGGKTDGQKEVDPDRLIHKIKHRPNKYSIR